MSQAPHLELQTLRSQLCGIYNAMSTFGSAQLALKPPILDSSTDFTGDAKEEFRCPQDAVHGLRTLKEAVGKDLDVLGKFLDDPRSASSPSLSTNAPYLISVWNEVLHAKPPIVTIWRTFFEGAQPSPVTRRGSRKPPGVKIDIVADGGRRWIRVNTTKNSRLLAELREIDSYQTESDSDDSLPSLAQTDFDNSILRMGRSLLDAARQNPLAGTTTVPSVTMRLTRLNPSPSDQKEYDPRIEHTIDSLRNMGIEVELGERDPAQLPAAHASPVRHLEPTIRVNLDLSILIALVSDITHSPLPMSTAEADIRYVPSAHYREWKRKRLDVSKPSDVEIEKSQFEEKGIGKHSRALANQALQEMRRGLLQALHDRLAAVTAGRLEDVEFWTTPEARDRCLRIVLSKIGGPNEKRRASALFPSGDLSLLEAEDGYWSHSRYPRTFLPLVPVRVFPSSVPPSDLGSPSLLDDHRVLPSFFRLLARTARDILSQEIAPHPRSSSPSPLSALREGEQATEEDHSEIDRAAATRANPRLTAHTVQSMLWGATRGWTTLTANKTSVKAILRDIREREGGYGPGHELNAKGSGVDETEELETVVEKAAIWVVDPRSLAEGMRSDYSE